MYILKMLYGKLKFTGILKLIVVKWHYEKKPTNEFGDWKTKRFWRPTWIEQVFEVMKTSRKVSIWWLRLFDQIFMSYYLFD